jgi:hypothetical protein
MREGWGCEQIVQPAYQPAKQEQQISRCARNDNSNSLEMTMTIRKRKRHSFGVEEIGCSSKVAFWLSHCGDVGTSGTMRRSGESG